ncbi:hypothetical protein PR003_g13472 [Phytophthora rubi]|uniref:Uncharacterized protein n=1 Tax=Phytophthora rubi TaxID=129364 RepID=A0A6A3NSZ2_9STRA|nr:hypothetical protein PR001_g7296 [Phytophthora rubi]KAE9048556.1 hypothetical protein PR002_g362 [Phytophthora rubi]KAE9334530.1 hypothetical protein PR003_g13472 [Phytophthora rubi]
MEVDGEKHAVKWDSCARYTVAGTDWMERGERVRGPGGMDFDRNEVRYFENDSLVIIPFCTDDGNIGHTKIAAVRLTRRVKLTRKAVTPITVTVTAPDGEQVIFVPTQNSGAVMLATTMTKVVGGKALIPAISMRGDRTSKKELGVWVPLTEDMQVLKMSGEMVSARIDEWIKSLGDTETPLNNEDEVRIGEDDAKT